MLKCVKIIFIFFLDWNSRLLLEVKYKKKNKYIKEIIVAIIIRHIIYRKPQNKMKNKFRHKLKVNFSQTCGAT